MSGPASGDGDLISALHSVLKHLQAHPYPHVPNPPGCKKRASVAVVLRIRPAYAPVPHSEPRSTLESAGHGNETEENQAPGSLDEFFSRDWVRDGDAEVLFIKRAGRAGDRWSGHVALPGGKRDPDDGSDMAAAMREAREEVGLDISGPRCLQAGNLPERVVATTWGREALMVLCPFIFVFTGKETPRIYPQPTEVAAAHWVPLRALLSPNLRTREYVDTASRMAKQGGWLAQNLLRALAGRMVFSAVHLVPSESIYASSIQGFLPSESESRAFELALGALPVPIELARPRLAFQQPLLLWGLTLGVLADFLDALPPHNAVKLWRYPTFTPPDLRFLIWLFTRHVRRHNANDVRAGTWLNQHPMRRRGSQTAMDATTQAVAVTEAEPLSLGSASASGKEVFQNEVGISGLGVSSNKRHHHDAVGRLLAGYYDRVHIAMAVFAVYRTALGSALGWWLFKLWRARRR